MTKRILLLALLVLPGVTLAEEERGSPMSIGDRLAALDTPLDLKAALLCYERVVEEGEMSARGTASGKIVRVKSRLHELAQPARERATESIAVQDWIEGERRLCEVVAIDPFDQGAKLRLADVRWQLRRQAVELQNDLLRRTSVSPFSLGVPPAFERLTNDPRFALPALSTHSG